MKAWQFIDDGKPLTLTDVPEAETAPDGVVINVKGAGICHSDVGYVTGVISQMLAFRPITLGHEIAGVIASVGEHVTDFKVGDRVVAPAKVKSAGTTLNGGFAAKVALPAEFVIPLPDGISWSQAAAASDAGMTSYHALITEGQVTAGMKVGIIGFGGLGSLGAQTALGAGAEVFVAEINEKAHDYARSLGVTEVGTEIGEFADRKLDVIVDFAGFGTTTASAISSVKYGGRVVVVGLGAAEATIPTAEMIFREITLIGSQGGSNEDCAGVLQMIADGKLTSRVEEISFQQIGDGVNRLQRGEVVGRLVAVLD